MSDGQMRPEAVDQAVAWLREHDARYTRDALTRALREQGYAEAEIVAAFGRRRDEQPAPPVRQDLRGRAAAILVLVFLGTWIVLSIPLLNSESMYGVGVIASFILAVTLGIIGLVSLAVIGASRRLKEGVRGALVVILAVPFFLLFIVAGLCVSTTGSSW